MINGGLALAMTILSKRINPLAIRKASTSTPQVPLARRKIGGYLLGVGNIAGHLSLAQILPNILLCQMGRSPNNAIKRGWLAFKGGISTGYKTPALPNLINGIANLGGQGSTHTYGNPNLKPESSINYEVSALSDNPYFSASITGFYTNFTDRISTTPSVAQGTQINGFTCGATTCSSYINVDEAISYGAETSLAIKPISVGYGTLGLNAAYTFTLTEITKSQEKKAIGTRLQNIPLHNLNASINYDSKHFGAYIRQEYKAGIYRGDPSIVGSAAATLGEYYKPITLTHLGAYYRFSDSLRINAAVYNLFNVDFVDYQRYATTAQPNYNYANAYNYIREGRRYYISVQMDF